MTITFPYMTIRNLPELTFIAGTYREISFHAYTSACVLINISNAEECLWTLSPYSQPDYKILTKIGITSASGFKIILNSEDTYSLAGKFIQTASLQSAGDYRYKIAQGVVNILPSIGTEDNAPEIP